MDAPIPARRIETAELLAVGSELTVGETRDTNGGELARELTELGVRVTRLVALPDELGTVSAAFAEGLERADVVVSTGGLGPTPDDLTREAIAAVCGEQPTVDPVLERWLRALWRRRGMPFPEVNLKQAWLIPSATALANPNGTAPGWWVDRPDGRVVVALPGPPREMRAMWAEKVVPRLRERGIGRDQVIRTLRTAGIGESQIADLLGGILTGRNPVVATYARADAVDIRISATPEPLVDGETGRTPDDLVTEAEAAVLAVLERHVWGRDRDTWPGAIGAALDRLGWTLGILEVGTRGTLTTLLGEIPSLRGGRLVAELDDVPAHDPAGDVSRSAEALRAEMDVDGAVAVRAETRGSDTAVHVAIATATGTHVEERLAFLGGAQGRVRAALLTAAVLLERLRAEEARRAATMDDIGDGQSPRAQPVAAPVETAE